MKIVPAEIGHFRASAVLERAFVDPGGRLAPVRYAVDMQGVVLDIEPAERWGYVALRRGDRVAWGRWRRMRITPLEPLPSSAWLELRRGRNSQMVYEVKGDVGDEAARRRALLGLELVLPGAARKPRHGRLEPEQLLGRLVAEDAGVGRAWWTLPVDDLLAGEVAMGRRPFYRYLDRFGWPMRALREFGRRQKKGTHGRAPPPDHGDTTTQEGGSDEADHGRDRRAHVRQPARAGAVRETGSARPGGAGARAGRGPAGATDPP